MGQRGRLLNIPPPPYKEQYNKIVFFFSILATFIVEKSISIWTVK